MSTQNCSNCYNGCTEITSDKCVKYTGVDVPILGIQNGDSLSFVEQALITFLGSTLDGTGIQPVVPPSDICPVVQANLDECNPLSLNNYLVGIIKTICELNDEIQQLSGSGNTDKQSSPAYNVECVSGVSDNTSTRDVLQQTIIKLCEVEQSLNTFITDVTTNYVQIVDINTYIENYLKSDPSQNLISNRMVPFSAQPYFGELSVFDSSGAGIGIWDRIFLCNGQNGTPDLRGRVPVGSTSMGSTAMDAEVDPALAGNPAYDLNNAVGTNSITLQLAQIPSHTHSASVVTSITPADHCHYTMNVTSTNVSNPPNAGNYLLQSQGTGGNLGYALRGTDAIPDIAKTDDVTLSASSTPTIQPAGGGVPHDNFQPGLGSYYIIYIP